MQLVSRQRIGKRVPTEAKTNATTEERGFLCGPCRGVILKTIGATSSVVSNQLGSEMEAEKRWRYS
jgi:hypothetical protein